MAFTFRPARPEDAADMDALLGAEDNPEKADARLRKLQGYLSLLKSERTYAVVAEEGSDLVGWSITRHLVPDAEVTDATPSGWYLMGVFVKETHRQQGLGHALTQERLDWLAHRAQEIYYFTTEDNAASLALHKALGFVEVRRGVTPERLAFDGGPSILFKRKM